jgi:hypothetical protein
LDHPVSRAEVYAAIDSERAYQDSLWNPATTPTNGVHHVASWLTYMQSYLSEAIDQVSRAADPGASLAALSTIRKITGMGVACMEQHGAPLRGNGLEIVLTQPFYDLPVGAVLKVDEIIPHGGHTDDACQYRVGTSFIRSGIARETPR